MNATQPEKRHHLLMRGALGLVFVYALGFAAFVVTLPAPGANAPKADAIVALTGDGDRLTPAVGLLEKGDGMRLLITGVNPHTTKQNLKSLLHGGAAFDCCADLGFQAADTRGNAAEAAAWARTHKYKRLIVVTAAYHMPRSMLEFAAAMPEVKLSAYPVAADAPGFVPNLRRLHGEYIKFLASIVRVNAVRLMGRA